MMVGCDISCAGRDWQRNQTWCVRGRMWWSRRELTAGFVDFTQKESHTLPYAIYIFNFGVSVTRYCSVAAVHHCPSQVEEKINEPNFIILNTKAEWGMGMLLQGWTNGVHMETQNPPHHYRQYVLKCEPVEIRIRWPPLITALITLTTAGNIPLRLRPWQTNPPLVMHCLQGTIAIHELHSRKHWGLKCTHMMDKACMTWI